MKYLLSWSSANVNKGQMYTFQARKDIYIYWRSVTSFQNLLVMVPHIILMKKKITDLKSSGKNTLAPSGRISNSLK